MFCSVSLSVTVQEATTSSLKPSLLRTSLAPQKAPRRSLDVCAHVLATQVAPQPDSNAQPVPNAPAAVNTPHAAYWTKDWTKALREVQTKFAAFWEKWQKLSVQFGQYKAVRPDWMGQTQEVLDQQFQRFLNTVWAAAAARMAPPTAATSDASTGAASVAVNRPMTLNPYLTVADEVEVSFAAMLADLCNMAYEVDKLDPELLESRHRLSLIASSFTCTGPAAAACVAGPGAGEAPTTSLTAAEDGNNSNADSTSAAVSLQAPSTPRAAAGSDLVAEHAEPLGAPSIVSFTMGGSPPLSPSISMLQLTTPEAVTAALTSQGHGAAFAHPVYVSTLHHALPSMGSYDEDGDASDMEWRAAVAATGPHAVLVGGPGAGSRGATGAAAAQGQEFGSLGTIGTFDEEMMTLRSDAQLNVSHSSDVEQAQQQQQLASVGDADGGIGATTMAAVAAGMQDQLVAHGGSGPASPTAVATYAVGSSGAAGGRPGSPYAFSPSSGAFLSDANLDEERDFLSGHAYGYNTPIVERRGSIDGFPAAEGAIGDGAAAVTETAAATTIAGAVGGRALRAEQEQSGRRRSSTSGGGMGPIGGGEAAAVGAAAGAADVAEGAGAAAEGEMPAMAGNPPVVVASAKAPPSAWFAVDDKLTKTRYFTIQGSTSLEHWQINFQFEPVVFEDPKYGVRVHRGVYEAAKLLYDDLLPLVQQHLETSPYASVSFSGHSLGGSLATVLMLLFVSRGVLKPSNTSPVYTFGAPAIFCRGAAADAPPDRCASCSLACDHAHAATAAAATGGNGASGAASPLSGVAAAAASLEQADSLPIGLLSCVGLSEDHVVNVIMHKDIVPRAFVCDYTAVAGVLHSWWPSLREHAERQGTKDGPHRSLYSFVGRVAVLRPSADLPFINGPNDAAHPMLPNHPALYRVGLHDEAHPLPVVDASCSAASLASYASSYSSLASWDDLLLGGWSAVSARVIAGGAAAGRGRAGAGGSCRRRVIAGAGSGASTNSVAVAEARRASKLAGMQQRVMDFMNQPHPLTTLGDYQAYGPNGAISRFHNPDNYTRALTALLTR